MLFDIRTAALDELAEQRVRLAVSLLPAYQLRARVGSWDGTRCHLLVAAAGDAYGRQVLRLASRRGTPVIAFGEQAGELDLEPVDPLSTAPALARTMLARLKKPAPHAPDGNDQGQASRPAICRLASAPLLGKPVRILHGGRRVLLDPGAGRAYAATHADLLMVAGSMSETEWEMRPVEPSAVRPEPISSSLEAFLLSAADRVRDSLPAFPDRRVRLEAWPDLGTVPSLTDALRIARRLIREPLTPGELRADGDLDVAPAALNACLWALAAADLLADAAPAKPADTAPAPPRRLTSKIWASLARHFGLQSGERST